VTGAPSASAGRGPTIPGAEVPMKYRVVLHASDEGFAVSVPGLPGCWSQGATEREALENIRDAIREYLAAVEDEAKDQDIREVEVAT
jgi:predicted RNase H-like HicB family nuclease